MAVSRKITSFQHRNIGLHQACWVADETLALVRPRGESREVLGAGASAQLLQEHEAGSAVFLGLAP